MGDKSGKEEIEALLLLPNICLRAQVLLQMALVCFESDET